MHYQTVTPFEQWMRDNVYGKMAPSAEIKELLAMAFEGGQKAPHTHPAQPLSDDEMSKVFDDIVAGCYGDDDFWFKFARAIEQAHGIGVKE